MTPTRTQKTLAFLAHLAWIALAVAIASVGLKAFLLPNGFLDGGVTGIALLLEVLLDVPLSLGLLAMSIPFLVLAYFTVSRRVMWKSVFGIVSLAAVLEFEAFPVITENNLLIAIFGGLCLGLGIGTAIRSGAVLGDEVGFRLVFVHLGTREDVVGQDTACFLEVVGLPLTGVNLSVVDALERHGGKVAAGGGISSAERRPINRLRHAAPEAYLTSTSTCSLPLRASHRYSSRSLSPSPPARSTTRLWP